MTCLGCGQMISPEAQFCSHCGRAITVRSVPALYTGKLIRPRDGRMIAGVCAGFALRYGWDVVLVRLVLVLALIFGAGTPLLAYLIAWIVMPNAQFSLTAGSGPGSPAGPIA